MRITHQVPVPILFPDETVQHTSVYGSPGDDRRNTDWSLLVRTA